MLVQLILTLLFYLLMVGLVVFVYLIWRESVHRSKRVEMALIEAARVSMESARTSAEAARSLASYLAERKPP